MKIAILCYYKISFAISTEENDLLNVCILCRWHKKSAFSKGVMICHRELKLMDLVLTRRTQAPLSSMMKYNEGSCQGWNIRYYNHEAATTKKTLGQKAKFKQVFVDVENAFGHALRIVIGWKKLLEYLNEPSHLYKWYISMQRLNLELVVRSVKSQGAFSVQCCPQG